MCREGHTSLATASVTIAASPAMSSLFQQLFLLSALMFLRAIGLLGRTYLHQARTISQSVNKPFKQNSRSLAKSVAMLSQPPYRPTRSPPARQTEFLLPCGLRSVNWEIVSHILDYCATYPKHELARSPSLKTNPYT